MRSVKMVELYRGRKYFLKWKDSKTTNCLFIKSTKKGYNFLDLKSCKIIFESHFYPVEYQDVKKDSWFFVNSSLSIKENSKQVNSFQLSFTADEILMITSSLDLSKRKTFISGSREDREALSKNILLNSIHSVTCKT